MMALTAISFLTLSSLVWKSVLGSYSSPIAVGNTSPFRIVIDGGSTGSRLHIFEFVYANADERNASLVKVVDCIRRGSARANVPLSAFAPTRQEPFLNSTFVAEHLLPLFEYAAQVVPAVYHATTHVTYQATAGMRLLDLDEQEAVYDALYEGLLQSESFVFRSMKRSDIATLSGELEGLYGAIAANFLEGVIDVNLHTTKIPSSPRILSSSMEGESSIPSDDAIDHFDAELEHSGPIGALDMGGSSTQIVFIPTTNARSCNEREWDRDSCWQEDTEQVTNNASQRLNEQDFFSTSYLSYGVDQFRERLWSTWVRDRQSERDGRSCDSKILENPCAFKGYALEWEGYTLVGTGNTDECIRQVQRLIPHADDDDIDNVDDSNVYGSRKVGGVEHPPVRGKFFAMSLYFFTLDSLRVLSEPHQEAHQALNLSWPRPSLEELHNALYGLCTRSWFGDLYDIQHNAHEYTRAEVLPHRCFEAVYMVTLLRDGFGFDPQSRDITFTFLVDGSEVEWTLGMALSLQAEQQSKSRRMITAADIDFQNPSSSTEKSSIIASFRPMESNLTEDDEDEEQECSCVMGGSCPEVF